MLFEIVIMASTFLVGTKTGDKDYQKRVCDLRGEKNCSFPDVTGDLVQVATIDSWKDSEYVPNVNPYYRYRAFVFYPIDPEGRPPKLIVEKLKGDMMGYFLQFQEQIVGIANDKMRAELGTLSFEEALGCCSFSNLRWNGFSLQYSIDVKQIWNCKIEDINKSRKPECLPNSSVGK